MPQNRLRLDFSLQTSTERLDFLNKYLPTLNFTPNEHETETLSDYLLWGKDPKTGLNSQQEGISLKEWAPASNVESIEALTEVPTFQETRFQSINSTQYYSKRAVFNREEALQKSDPLIREVLEDLFDEIDRTELVINFYELENGKRKNPPRNSLLKRFSTEETETLRRRAAQINGRTYLQLRHYLVELRTEQYTYKDLIQPQVQMRSELGVVSQNEFRFDEDLCVRPLGLHDGSAISKKIFKWPPEPTEFSEEELKYVSDQIWGKTNKLVFNFEDPEHLLVLYKNYQELIGFLDTDPDQIYSAAGAIIRTLQFYESMALLSEAQRELLRMKIEQKTNNEIRMYINNKYGTAYNENYISTIYRKKILPTIANAAKMHKMVMDNIFYPENFKTCKDCGRVLLRAPEFFMRQYKATDGFSSHCKECQKKKRERKKENGKKY